MEQTDQVLRVWAAGLLTGINVGLNDVTLIGNAAFKRVGFEIWYWTWAKYAVGRCLVWFPLAAGVLVASQDTLPKVLFQGRDRSWLVLNWSIAGFFGLT